VNKRNKPDAAATVPQQPVGRFVTVVADGAAGPDGHKPPLVTRSRSVQQLRIFAAACTAVKDLATAILGVPFSRSAASARVPAKPVKSVAAEKKSAVD
jgi:hypothetical protein